MNFRNVNLTIISDELEQCYYKASTKSSHEFAESLDYGGYDSEDEFWENLG